MRIPIYQVDAFASRRFEGNPAAVCPLDAWLPDATLLAIAAENNLSETAFFVAREDRWHLRWFTPAAEVDLCGHATLASAFVLFTRLGASGPLRFDTHSGPLHVTRDRDLLAMDFPATPPAPVEPCPGLLDALGGDPIEVLAGPQYLVIYRDEAAVRAVDPDMKALSKADRFATIVSAPGDDVDFVSRFFAPAKGVPEDPVTGSAHCTLTPYWAARLGKTRLRARQVSRRGGDVGCSLAGDRVHLEGRAVLYLEGSIEIDEPGA